MGDNPTVVGASSNVVWSQYFNQLGYEPVQVKEPSYAPIWWLNTDQYVQPAKNNLENLGWAFPTNRSNYNLFNENLLGVGSDTLVFNTPDSQTVIAPISDPHNSVWLAAYSERYHEPSFQNLMAQTNGLSLMFDTSDDSFIGFTGGITNSMIPYNDHFDNSVMPFCGIIFRITN